MNYTAALFLLLISSSAQAATPEERGLEIARMVHKTNEGFKGEKSELEMILINAHGDRTVRRMASLIREVVGEGDKSRIEFQWPADVKGTRMLTWSHKASDDDQWLFLPAVKRVKRIASRNKSGSFMGSEFSYEDLGSPEIEKFKHKFLGDVTVNGRPCWRLERIPVDPTSGYSKEVTVIDQGMMNPVSIEYYDRKGDLLKTGTFENYAQISGYFRVQSIRMENHQTKKSSILSWKSRELGVSLDDALFDSNELDG